MDQAVDAVCDSLRAQTQVRLFCEISETIVSVTPIAPAVRVASAGKSRCQPMSYRVMDTPTPASSLLTFPMAGHAHQAAQNQHLELAAEAPEPACVARRAPKPPSSRACQWSSWAPSAARRRLLRLRRDCRLLFNCILFIKGVEVAALPPKPLWNNSCLASRKAGTALRGLLERIPPQLFV